MIELILPELPDTLLKDRLIELNSNPGLSTTKAVAMLGTGGYVVHSVPFAIFCASKVREIGLQQMFTEIIAAGGDTDTNASIAGQIAGTLIGNQGIPAALLDQLKLLKEYDWISLTVQRLKESLRDNCE